MLEIIWQEKKTVEDRQDKSVKEKNELEKRSGGVINTIIENYVLLFSDL